MVSATEVNRDASRFISEAHEGRTFVVMRNNKPVAGIVSAETLANIQQIDEDRLDLRLLAVSLIRHVTDTGERFTLDDVAAELGIEED